MNNTDRGPRWHDFREEDIQTYHVSNNNNPRRSAQFLSGSELFLHSRLAFDAVIQLQHFYRHEIQSFSSALRRTKRHLDEHHIRLQSQGQQVFGFECAPERIDRWSIKIDDDVPVDKLKLVHGDEDTYTLLRSPKI